MKSFLVDHNNNVAAALADAIGIPLDRAQTFISQLHPANFFWIAMELNGDNTDEIRKIYNALAAR